MAKELRRVGIEALKGQIIDKIKRAQVYGDRGDMLVFITHDAAIGHYKQNKFQMYHMQDCCEHVWLESVDGDLKWLIDQEVVEAYESSNQEDLPRDDSRTWTFYTIRCNKASVNLRWCGVSNGYYSKSVDFVEVVE